MINPCLPVRFRICHNFYLFILPLLILPMLAGDTRNEEIHLLRQEIELLRERLERLEQAEQDREQQPPREPSATGPQRPIDDELVLLDFPEPQQALTATEQVDPEPAIRIKGALRFNAYIRDFDQGGKNRKGDSGFELFRIGIEGQQDSILIAAEYRFYPYMDVLHHGWLGYEFSPDNQVMLGVSQVPFGLLPYAAHNYWFGVPYYVGLADNHAMGLQYIKKDGDWDLRLAFYKNPAIEDATNLNRYAFGVVRVDEQQNQQSNQLNARLARTWVSAEGHSHEFGLSTQVGQLYNEVTQSNGNHWAVAIHWNTHINRWNAQVQLARYQFNPKNPPGVNDRVVRLGALATHYDIAAKGTVAVANLAYTVPLTQTFIDQLIFYNNYSILKKDDSSFRDSQINTLGAAIGVGPLFMYLDWIQAKNMPFFGDGSLADEGESSWKSRFNFNLGYYW